jgi:carbohydrate binding protein with CBM11 domain
MDHDRTGRWMMAALLLCIGGGLGAAEPASQNVLLIADFNSGEQKNKMGGDLTTWASTAPDPEGQCAQAIEPAGGPDGSGAWVISYDISKEGAYCGTGMDLKNLDASRFKTLGFRVKGDLAAPVDFIIELKVKKDANNLEIKRYVVKGVGNEWKTIQIPLAEFHLPSLTALTELTTVFDKQTTKVRKGDVRIDDVVLLP